MPRLTLATLENLASKLKARLTELDQLQLEHESAIRRIVLERSRITGKSSSETDSVIRAPAKQKKFTKTDILRVLAKADAIGIASAKDAQWVCQELNLSPNCTGGITWVMKRMIGTELVAHPRITGLYYLKGE